MERSLAVGVVEGREVVGLEVGLMVCNDVEVAGVGTDVVGLVVGVDEGREVEALESGSCSVEENLTQLERPAEAAWVGTDVVWVVVGVDEGREVEGDSTN